MSEAELWSLTVPKLRDLMRTSGIAPNGATRKGDLIARILEAQGGGAGRVAVPTLQRQTSSEKEYEEEFASEQIGNWSEEPEELGEPELTVVPAPAPTPQECELCYSQLGRKTSLLHVVILCVLIASTDWKSRYVHSI